MEYEPYDDAHLSLFGAVAEKKNRKLIQDIFTYFNVGLYDDDGEDVEDYSDNMFIWECYYKLNFGILDGYNFASLIKCGKECTLFEDRPDLLKKARACGMNSAREMFVFLNALFPGTIIVLRELSIEHNLCHMRYKKERWFNAAYDGEKYLYEYTAVISNREHDYWRSIELSSKTLRSKSSIYPCLPNRSDVETLIEISAADGNTQLTALLLGLLHRIDTGTVFSQKEIEKCVRLIRPRLLNRIRCVRDRARKFDDALADRIDLLRAEVKAAKTPSEIELIEGKLPPLLKELEELKRQNICARARVLSKLGYLRRHAGKVSDELSEMFKELRKQIMDAGREAQLNAIVDRIQFIRVHLRDPELSRREAEVLCVEFFSPDRGEQVYKMKRAMLERFKKIFIPCKAEAEALHNAILEADADDWKALEKKLEAQEERVRTEREFAAAKDLLLKNTENVFYEGAWRLRAAVRDAQDMEALTVLPERRPDASLCGFDRYPVVSSDGDRIVFLDSDGTLRVLNNSGRFELKNGTVRIFGSPRVFKAA